MQITYNKIEKTIEIKDGLKIQYMLLKSLGVVTIVNAILNLLDIKETGIGFVQILWLSLGSLSLVFLCYLIFKKSSLDSIPVYKIKKFIEKSARGKKGISLELTNGKFRDLATAKTQQEFNELKKLLRNIGIEE